MSDVSTINGYAALYADIMAEVKARHTALFQPLDGITAAALPSYVLAEAAYLQLRMICELIAHGCLVAHGDIEATKRGKLETAWNADLIVSALSKLHPEFYPTPSHQVVLGPGRFELREVTEPYLTKADLQRLYAETGRVLHRGSVQNLPGRTVPTSNSVRDWSEKISFLLTHHQIVLANSDLEIWCLMHGMDDGKVHTTVMRRSASDAPLTKTLNKT